MDQGKLLQEGADFALTTVCKAAQQRWHKNIEHGKDGSWQMQDGRWKKQLHGDIDGSDEYCEDMTGILIHWSASPGPTVIHGEPVRYQGNAASQLASSAAQPRMATGPMVMQGEPVRYQGSSAAS